MERFFQHFLLFFLSVLVSGCAGYGPVVVGSKPKAAQVHAWKPSSDEDRKIRRVRQRERDEIADGIELLMFHSELAAKSSGVMKVDFAEVQKELDALNSRIDSSIIPEYEKIKAQEKIVRELQARAKEIEDELEAGLEGLEPLPEIEKDQARKDRSKIAYVAAMVFFKNGEYAKALALFKKSLQLRPSKALQDNVYFAIGSCYFKLKKYDWALDPLNRVVEDYPRSEKWFLATLLLAWIHNDRGETSRALYLLDNAKKKKPTKSMLKSIRRMENLILGEGKDGVS